MYKYNCKITLKIIENNALLYMHQTHSIYTYYQGRREWGFIPGSKITLTTTTNIYFFLSFEKLDNFKYLGVNINNENMHREINKIISNRNKCYFSVKLLRSTLQSRKSKCTLNIKLSQSSSNLCL